MHGIEHILYYTTIPSIFLSERLKHVAKFGLYIYLGKLINSRVSLGRYMLFLSFAGILLTVKSFSMSHHCI